MPSQAATIAVDNDGCTLIEAIGNANSDSDGGGNGCAAGSGADTITLPAASTITLTSPAAANTVFGLPPITSTITLKGNGSTVQRAANATAPFRLFTIEGTGNLTVERLLMTGGQIDSNGQNGGCIRINAGGRLSMTDSTVSGCLAFSSGGGLLNLGTLQLLRSAVINNAVVTGSGAGIANGLLNNAGAVTFLTASTVSGNTITLTNGGLGAGVSANGGTVNITDSTVTGNVSNSTGGGGGLRSTNSGRFTVTRSIISGNRAPLLPGSAELRAFGTSADAFTLNGYNLIGDNGQANSDVTLGATDRVSSQDIGSILAPLADNGGPTPTHMLQPGSPALNAVAAGCPANAVDQRGQLRPETSACDIGAVELSGSYVVNTLSDGDDGFCEPSPNDCKLREAINAANATIGIPDSIRFSIPGGGVISLNSALPEITAAGGPLQIDGPTDPAQAIVLDGRSAVRLMSSAAGSNLTLNHLSLRNGNAGEASSGNGNNGGAIRAGGALTLNFCTLTGNVAGEAFTGKTAGSGGAIDADGPLTITRSTLTGNAGGLVINGIGGHGGAIAARGTTLIVDSLLSGNAASKPNLGPGGDGGAIFATGALTITGSTLSGNRAGDGWNNRGGNGGAIHATGTTVIVNSTLTANTVGASQNDTAGSGGAISTSGALTLINTTVHGNALGTGRAPATPGTATAIRATGAAPALVNSIVSGDAGLCSGFPSSATGRNNLATDASCGNGDLLVGGAPVTVAALSLGMLASNGGPTPTLTLQSGSVAIDAGSDADCAADPVNGVDQRGVARPQGTRCDVGAVEATLTNVSVSKTASSSTATVGDAVRFTLTVRNRHSQPVSSVQLRDAVPSAFAITAVTPGSAQCTTSGNTVSCMLPTLAANDTATVTIDTTALTAGEVINTATVTGGSSADTDLRDNSSAATVTIAEPDTTPDAFSFASIGSVPRDSTQTSASATISGLGAAAAISVSDGSEYAIGCADGAFTSSDGTISNGQTVCMRHTAASAFATDTVTTLTIGGVAATFTSTTEARDITPDAVTFNDVPGTVEPGSTQRSSPVVIGGVNDDTPFTVTGGRASTSGLPCDPLFGETSGTVRNGDTIAVCHVAGAFGDVTTTTLTLGADGVLSGSTASFGSTTRDAVVVPDAFSFGSITGVERDSQRTSTSITITGIEAAVTVSVDIGEVSINGGAFGSGGTIEPGQTVQVRHTASSSFASTVTSTVTIGDVAGTFSSTTRAAVVVPNAFSFGSRTNVERGSVQTSEAVAITGLEAPATVSVDIGQVSINGGAFGSGGTIEPGQTVQVRHTASASFAGTVTSTVTIGGVAGTFTSTTSAEASAPAVSLDMNDVDFGRGYLIRFREITLNTSETQVVTLTNPGNAPLVISSITTTGDFRHTSTCGSAVPAAGSCTISIVFKPTQVGTRTGETRIVSNAVSSPDLISLNGVGKGLVPAIKTNASSYNFGNVKVGASSADRALVITSSGTGPLEIRSISVSGDYSGSHNCPRLLDAGKSCTLTGRFKPKAKGARPGTITISTSAPGSPTVITLSGNGT
ncbi:beta strand repeat-containing protein [Nevskia sp.]|uniref:beta strand repeat-containing protein n=1 Tax=Nevskia sp. TaxID=1929292 RepID=UPI003F721A94